MDNIKNFIEELKPFKLESYINIKKDKLIVFAVGLLTDNNIEPLFENIVVVAFKLFPEVFSLVGFSQYPDSKLVRDCLFHCTYVSKGWLLGSSKEGWGGKSGFYLTEKGKHILKETRESLIGKEIPLKIKKDKIETKVNLKQKSIISDIKNSETYRFYITNQLNNISEYDLRRVLRGSRTTTLNKLFDNYERLKGYASSLDDQEFIQFLDFVKKKIIEKSKVMKNEK
jgi:hypothetical protein